jgi:hypothetical protein
MNYNRVIFISGIVLLLLEVVCFVLAPGATTSLDAQPTADDLAYVPYAMAALTLGFVAFFVVLFYGIVSILKGEIIRNLSGLLSMTMAFVLPVILYYTFYS